jgi:hypothetical protein
VALSSSTQGVGGVRERRAWTTKCRRGATDLARLVGRADASGSPAEAGGLKIGVRV